MAAHRPAWPFGYDVYENYYEQAEKLYSTHGKQGIDPTEPWRKNDYPLPPLPYEPLIQDLEKNMHKIGLQPFP